ncbi:MAG: sigma-E factor negative regulatory protein [Pseudomonadales bacterium]|nr:sigma-E factor negative regulatory protein [Pseudomonadales bacterium]
MTEVRKESLSALIDGEASEIEVHRLVREFRNDDSLSASWGVYQKIRTTAQRGADPLSLEHHQQLFARISSAIDAEDTYDEKPAARAAFSNKAVFGSLAIAASLVVAVFVGVQQPEHSAPVVDVTPTVVNAAPVSVNSVPMSHVAASGFVERGAPELIELDEEKQKQLRAYLQQHDRMSRMNPDTQFVNYPVGPVNVERATQNQ